MSEAGWIKMRTELTFDPAVVRIAAWIEQDEFSVVGRLHAVWSWLDKHSQDGTNVPVTSAFLDRLAACPGFADAMRTVAWLAGRDGALSFPNYTRHNGPTAKARAVEAKRKAEQRARSAKRDKPPDGNGTSGGTYVPGSAGLDKSRVDRRGRRARARDPAPPPAQVVETQAEWLARMKREHPGVDIDAELKAAERHQRKAGKKLDRAYFERSWLKNAGPVVDVGSQAAPLPEPDGWQDWLVRTYPRCQFVDEGRCTAKRFSDLPGDVQQEAIAALKKAS